MSLVNDESDLEASQRFLAAVDQAVGTSNLEVSGEHCTTIRVAFDCEGVDLSRVGTVELVSICFEKPIREKGEVFLVDLNAKGDPSKRSDRIEALKKLFGCKILQKVIHDSRMDCDALFHLDGIRVVNMHDTSCCHSVITGREDESLNDLLSHNRISEIEMRDKSVYKINPAYWATRPITTTMIEWAASDVDKLLLLATMQKDKLEKMGNYDEAMEKSSEFTTVVRDMKLARGLQCRANVGRFIGTRGCNIRSLQKRTNTMIYQEHRGQTWMVFYNDLNSLKSVKSAMGY